MTTVVSHASPLIILSMIGELARLEELFEKIHITPEVYDEIVVRGHGKPGSTEVAAASYVRVHAVKDAKAIAEIQEAHHLAVGEASALALAREMGADLLVIDDKHARTAGMGMGFAVAGTLRVLEMAYERGFLPDLRSIYRRMVRTSIRIAPELLEESLRRLDFPPL